MAYDPFRRRDGELWALMLTVYAVTRFLEEIVRTDEAPILGTGMTISQNVSLLLLLAAIGDVGLRPPSAAGVGLWGRRQKGSRD